MNFNQMINQLNKVEHPASRYCLKSCLNFEFNSLDKVLHETSLFIETDYNLHLSHNRAAVFFDPSNWKTNKQCFAGFEVVGQATQLNKIGEHCENSEEFVLFDQNAGSWQRSHNFGEFYQQDTAGEFSKKVFNFLDNLHNGGYSEDLSARLLIDFKPDGLLQMPKVFIEVSDKTIIDIDDREK